MSDYQEVILTCRVCGKEVRAVVRKEMKEKKFMCQQCAKKLNIA